MCLSPIRVQKPSLQNSFIRRVYEAKLPDALKHRVTGYHINSVLVPCGKCVECLKRKQNDLAVRCVRQAEKSGNMVFVTLTYNDDKLPIACTTQLIDKSTGEVLDNEVPYVGTYKDFRSGVLSQNVGITPRYSYNIYEDFSSDYALGHTFTPSLDRTSFRLYLKRKRQEFKRKEGLSLPDFKYVAVGEYGPKTCRPHIHCAFFGLPLDKVRWLFDEWSKDIGYIQVKQVKYINDDGSKGYAIASKYVGKYMCKGKYDCDSVVKGLAEKPRVCISRDFGSWLTPELVSYYRAYDLFGQYHTNDISKFSEIQLQMLCNEINARSRVNVYGNRYALPNSMKKRLFYHKKRVFNEITHKFEIRYEADSIQAYRLALLQNSFVDDLLANLRSIGLDPSPKDFAKAVAYSCIQEKVNSSLKQKIIEADFLKSFASSIF